MMQRLQNGLIFSLLECYEKVHVQHLLSHAVLPQTCDTIYNLETILAVQPGLNVCFQCPVSNPNWIVEGAPIDPGLGQVQSGVLRIFNAEEVFSPNEPTFISCSISVFSVVFLNGKSPALGIQAVLCGAGQGPSCHNLNHSIDYGAVLAYNNYGVICRAARLTLSATIAA